MTTLAQLDAAVHGLLGAAVAARDAHRLIRIGYCAAAEPHQAVVDAAEARDRTIDECLVLCATKYAAQAIECYDRDPKSHVDGRTADTAFDAGLKIARKSFRGGKCEECKGPALVCARYAATRDRWCANT